VANPGGEKLAREASWIHDVGKFAKQIELAFRMMLIESGTEK
jgi:CRISPR/Cas system-associated endonuclease Cas3-HD